MNIRDDLASALGGEVTVALDGPVLPTPSWKAIIEVNQSGALQLAIEKMVQAANQEAQKENEPGVTLSQTQVGGRTFYTIQPQKAGLTMEYDYTFADGYLILAPSRALLLAAIETHENGTSLARSASFRGLLPSDNQANFLRDDLSKSRANSETARFPAQFRAACDLFSNSLPTRSQA